MKIAFIIPPNYDYLCATVIEGLFENNLEIYTNEGSNYGFKLNRYKFIKYANEASYVFISSGKLTDYSYLKYINNKNIIYIDGSDLPTIEHIFHKNYLFFFKRELLKNTLLRNQGFYPLPFAIEKRYFPSIYLNKDIKVSYVCSLNNFFRRSAFLALKQNFLTDSFIGSTGEVAYNGVNKLPLNSPIYYNILNRSLISINIPGKGWDCSRYWEIIANKSCLLTYRLDIEIPYALIENEHYFAFSTIEEMIEKCHFLINNPKIAIETAEKALTHVKIHHTTKARVNYLLKIITSNSEFFHNSHNFKLSKIYSFVYYKVLFFLYKIYKYLLNYFKKFI